MKMRNFKLVIEYEGTNYQGWQVQNPWPAKISSQGRQKFKFNKPKTIQGEIEAALKKLFGKKIQIVGSGRTDSGAHALGQVANFKCETSLKSENIRKALNSFLPPDIRILKLNEGDEDFHARFKVKTKLYRYLILNRKTNSVFYRRFSWWLPDELNFPAMRRATKVFLGRHNFRAFTASDPKRKSNKFIRTVKRISLKRYRNFIVLDIEADGFLYNMVRNIVGTLVEVGREKLLPQDIKYIFSLGTRRLAGPTAPSRGLFLVRVKY